MVVSSGAGGGGGKDGRGRSADHAGVAGRPVLVGRDLAGDLLGRTAGCLDGAEDEAAVADRHVAEVVNPPGVAPVGGGGGRGAALVIEDGHGRGLVRGDGGGREQGPSVAPGGGNLG